MENFRCFLIWMGTPGYQTAENLMNIINHVYPEGPEPVSVVCSRTDEGMMMQFENEGLFFDPTRMPTPDLAAAIEDRVIGGLGIHMLRQMADSMIYGREGRTNIVSMLFAPYFYRSDKTVVATELPHDYFLWERISLFHGFGKSYPQSRSDRAAMAFSSPSTAPL